MKLMRFEEADYLVAFFCPGCECAHQVAVNGGKHPHTNATWGWNGSMESPTFTPSVKVTWNGVEDGAPLQKVCHSFVTAGKIAFLADSTHKLAGQTVDLPEWEGKF